MTKQDAIKSIYGENPKFQFDYAIPLTLVDELVNQAMQLPYNTKEKHELYGIIVSGCVYAYNDRPYYHSLLPFTLNAMLLLSELNYATFTPTIEIK